MANTIKPDKYIMEKYSLIRYSLNKNPPIIFREITNETPTKDFDEWWNKIVISDGNVQGNTYFTRKDIVLYLADKEGGAHVDSNYDKEKDEAYYNSTRSYQLGKSGSFFNNMKTGELISLNELVFLYSVIAISFEMIATLFDAIPEIREMQVIKGVSYEPPATNIIEDFSMILAD